jgi:hypothetical protein
METRSIGRPCRHHPLYRTPRLRTGCQVQLCHGPSAPVVIGQGDPRASSWVVSRPVPVGVVSQIPTALSQQRSGHHGDQVARPQPCCPRDGSSPLSLVQHPGDQDRAPQRSVSSRSTEGPSGRPGPCRHQRIGDLSPLRRSTSAAATSIPTTPNGNTGNTRPWSPPRSRPSRWRLPGPGYRSGRRRTPRRRFRRDAEQPAGGPRPGCHPGQTDRDHQCRTPTGANRVEEQGPAVTPTVKVNNTRPRVPMTSATAAGSAALSPTPRPRPGEQTADGPDLHPETRSLPAGIPTPSRGTASQRLGVQELQDRSQQLSPRDLVTSRRRRTEVTRRRRT